MEAARDMSAVYDVMQGTVKEDRELCATQLNRSVVDSGERQKQVRLHLMHLC